MQGEISAARPVDNPFRYDLQVLIAEGGEEEREKEREVGELCYPLF
jgi:hypothetical protein